MNRLVKIVNAAVLALMLSTAAFAQHINPPVSNSSASTPITVRDETSAVPNSRRLVNGTNTTVDTSTPGQVKINASGGGGASTPSPFAPAGFANVSTFNKWTMPVVSPDGAYVYVGGSLSSNSHDAIAKVKIADGTVITVDLGIANGGSNGACNLAVSPDGAHIYAVDQNNGTPWWDVSTAGMTIAHASTLAHPISTGQPYDLSADGTKYLCIDASGTDTVYEISTSTYVVTPVTVGHSDGGAAGASSVCWYNGSSSNFYVAYSGVATVDLYSSGTYTSSVATGAGGTPAFNAMRSGINGNFFILDQQADPDGSVIVISSGTPKIYPMTGSACTGIAVNTLSPVATAGDIDVCYIQGILHNTISTELWAVSPFTPVLAIPTPFSVANFGASGIAVLRTAVYIDRKHIPYCLVCSIANDRSVVFERT